MLRLLCQPVCLLVHPPDLTPAYPGQKSSTADFKPLAAYRTCSKCSKGFTYRNVPKVLHIQMFQRFYISKCCKGFTHPNAKKTLFFSLFSFFFYVLRLRIFGVISLRLFLKIPIYFCLFGAFVVFFLSVLFYSSGKKGWGGGGWG